MVILLAQPCRRGSIHDLSAARDLGIIDALTSRDVMTFADKEYQGAVGTDRTPRSNGTVHACHDGRRPSTVTTPASSWRSWSSCAAARAAPPRLCGPSSSCATSKRTRYSR
jgi:hypothetical protein